MARETLPKKDMTEPTDDFEAVYQANQPLIYRFMFWRTKDQMLAEDLTSHVFEKAWRTRHNFSGGSIRAWLYRIARTTLIDYWRRNREIVGEVEVESDADDLGASYDQALDLHQLRRALKRLPSPMAEVVQLRFIEDKSVRQVAARLDLSEANVRVIQYRALQKLRDEMR